MNRVPNSWAYWGTFLYWISDGPSGPCTVGTSMLLVRSIGRNLELSKLDVMLESMSVVLKKERNKRKESLYVFVIDSIAFAPCQTRCRRLPASKKLLRTRLKPRLVRLATARSRFSSNKNQYGPGLRKSNRARSSANRECKRAVVTPNFDARQL